MTLLREIASISAGAQVASFFLGGALLALTSLKSIPLRRWREKRLILDLLACLENRDCYTASHCFRVAAFADLIAEALGGLPAERLRRLRVAALLHDLGKLEVPLEILHKPGSLDQLEWEIMRGHVEDGERLAASLDESVRNIIAQHHERPDGKGYPRGLSDWEICLEARIVAVADAFDAMTSNRPYRPALEPEVALEELRRCAGLGGVHRGLQFDPDVVRALEAKFQQIRGLCTPATAAQASPLA